MPKLSRPCMRATRSLGEEELREIHDDSVKPIHNKRLPYPSTRKQLDKKKRELSKLMILRTLKHPTGDKYNTAEITTTKQFNDICASMTDDELKLVKHDVEQSTHSFKLDFSDGTIEGVFNRNDIECENCLAKNDCLEKDCLVENDFVVSKTNKAIAQCRKCKLHVCASCSKGCAVLECNHVYCDDDQDSLTEKCDGCGKLMCFKCCDDGGRCVLCVVCNEYCSDEQYCSKDCQKDYICEECNKLGK